MQCTRVHVRKARCSDPSGLLLTNYSYVYEYNTVKRRRGHGVAGHRVTAAHCTTIGTGRKGKEMRKQQRNVEECKQSAEV